MTFFGEPRGDKHTHDHAHESPAVMLVPLGVLAIGAIFSGMVFFKGFFGDHHDVETYFGIAEAEHHATAPLMIGAAHAASAASDDGHSEAAPKGATSDAVPGKGAIYMHPDNHVLDEAHHAPKWVKVSPFVAMVIGFFFSWLFYVRNTSLPGRLANTFQPIYQFLLNKWYFDELYDAIFVRPARWLGGFLWKRGDGNVIDGTINGLAMGLIPFFTRLAGKMQSGYVFHYATAMVIGIALILSYFAIGGAE